MRKRSSRRRGSALILALAVLAMLAIMATTFITLTRLDVRITATYADNQQCEQLALGVGEYCKALLRDDLDRTWGKFENRDTSVGAVGFVWSGTYPGGRLSVQIPGLTEYSWGTPISNDFWFSPPYRTWADFGNIYATDAGSGGLPQQSFGMDYGYGHSVVGRYYNANSGREADVWVARALNCWDDTGHVVCAGHPRTVAGIDDDGNGSVNPPYISSYYDTPPGYSAYYDNYYEETSATRYYYDTAPFVLYAGDTYFFPGTPFTGEKALPGGNIWRWAVKLGAAHGCYLDLNSHGNVDGVDTAWLDDMGGVALKARRAADEALSNLPTDFGHDQRPSHLGRVEWRGFTGEYEFGAHGGFPPNYDAVNYQASQISLERLFRRDTYPGLTPAFPPNITDMKVDREKARNLVRYRWGNGSGVPCGGDPRYRAGWRRDGATYFKFPSPDNPLGRDRYFGANEVMEHDHSVDHPGTSAVAAILGDRDWRTVRPHVTMWSTDTILRGKIWPTEGPPYTLKQGDWRHIDILKRVNVNMIGASGPEGTLGEDAALKSKWLAKRDRERERLYYMLVAAMRFTNTAPPDGRSIQQAACQFIASLADMVDRDNNETYYAAPGGIGACALGVEKSPVLNEIVFLSERNANKDSYEMSLLRVEFYNPMHNIPWIPDGNEAYDISDCVLTINTHEYPLNQMRVFDSGAIYLDRGPISTIGADGMFGDPNDLTPDHKSWSRFIHAGWPSRWPAGVTKQELQNGLTFALYKPLRDPAAQAAAAAGTLTGPGVKQLSDARWYICVDKTEPLRLVAGYTSPNGPGGSSQTFLGEYRRWDPMNAKLYGTQGAEASNVAWCPGWAVEGYATLGRPNAGYPVLKGSGTSPYTYRRFMERNFKIVDGDLPSIGWLGELMMKNCAQDGPLTCLHTAGQRGDVAEWSIPDLCSNELDYKAKFDLFRPFWPAGQRKPNSGNCHAENLHILDIFTVWDPSNDGIDNDGDGAVDDEDTGTQAGDKCGPEVRVFGMVDINLIGRNVGTAVLPDNKDVRGVAEGFLNSMTYYRAGQRSPDGYFGPYETVGDLLRADRITGRPGVYVSVDAGWINGPMDLSERGISGFSYNWSLQKITAGDDDGDGVYDERDERDQLFTWLSNYITTRSNVFEMDLNVDLCTPPYYPGCSPRSTPAPVKLPSPAYRSGLSFARKQLLAIFDRSTCLRINSNGTCEFTGPVEVRMLRFTEDQRVH
jgi:hypothetical protein